MALSSFVNTTVNKSEISPAGRMLVVLEPVQCNRPGCSADAADDANECTPHRDQRRERVRRAMRKKRKAWAEAKRCLVCGKPRRAGSKWGCAGCVAEAKGVAEFVNTTVNNKRSRVAAAQSPRTSASNLGRMHNHGHGARGRVSNAQLDAQDFTDAIRLAAKAAAQHEYANGPEAAALPVYQRTNEKNAALADAARCIRHLAEILHRNKVDVRELVATTGDDGE